MSDAYPMPAFAPMLAPGAIFCSGEESIRVTAINAAASVALALSGRTLPIRLAGSDPPVDVGNFRDVFTPATNRTASTQLRQLGAGWVLDWGVFVSSGSPLIGQCWISVDLVRGQLGATQVLSHLGHGYITANQPIGGGSPQLATSLEGGGALRSITGTDPAAGAEVSETVPTGARWQLIGFSVNLVTSAVVANRATSFFVDDGANVYFANTVQAVQTATQTIRCAFGPIGVTGANGGNVYLAGSPDPLYLGAGHRIRTVTVNIDVGDNYGAPQYLVREWMEGN
jgi:hypothetical protein